jgi:DNA-binding MarR family transcriptional regulator
MDTDKQPIGFLNGVIHRGSHRYFEKELASLGLHRGMIHILKQLYRKDSVSQQALCTDILVDKANITRVLRRMEAINLIRRETDPSDGRSKIICLTYKARAMEAPLRAVLNNWNEILTEGMSDADKVNLQKLMAKCILNIHSHFIK